MATRKGLEPSTSGVTGRRSNQLNYRAISDGCWRPLETEDPTHRTVRIIACLAPFVNPFFQDFLKKSFPGKLGGQDLRPSRLKQPQGPLPLPPCCPPAMLLCALCTKIRPGGGQNFSLTAR